MLCDRFGTQFRYFYRSVTTCHTNEPQVIKITWWVVEVLGIRVDHQTLKSTRIWILFKIFQTVHKINSTSNVANSHCFSTKVYQRWWFERCCALKRCSKHRCLSVLTLANVGCVGHFMGAIKHAKNFTVHIAHNHSFGEAIVVERSGSLFIEQIACIHNHNQSAGWSLLWFMSVSWHVQLGQTYKVLLYNLTILEGLVENTEGELSPILKAITIYCTEILREDGV